MGDTAGPRRRRFTRISFQGEATLDLKVARLGCALLDLSIKGALVELLADRRVAPGTTCTLVIPLGEEAQVRMDGEIAHVAGRRLGVKADEMDLESMAHLRRLLELNLGDDRLVERELAALVAERDW